MPADDADSGEDETIDETLFVVRDPPGSSASFDARS
jgi:hypothetical protein